MIEIQAYKCEFCSKLYQKQHFCIKHEVMCNKNPENDRKCLSCQHLEKKETEVFYDHFDGSETSRKIELLYCSKLSTFVYPPKVEHKGNAFGLDDGNIPMKRECDKFLHFGMIDEFEHTDSLINLPNTNQTR